MTDDETEDELCKMICEFEGWDEEELECVTLKFFDTPCTVTIWNTLPKEKNDARPTIPRSWFIKHKAQGKVVDISNFLKNVEQEKEYVSIESEGNIDVIQVRNEG